MNELQTKRCMACEAGVPPLTQEKIQQFLSVLPLWEFNPTKSLISRHFKFKNFYQTMAFVNAVAWIANQENHHPDMQIGFNYCLVKYTTHAIDGLSKNDFICASKINNLNAS